MTRLEALTDLRDKVKAGSIAHHDLDAFIPVFGLTTQGNDAHSAHNGSLDAAKALHEAVLPGWDWLVASVGEYVRGPHAIIIRDAMVQSDCPSTQKSSSDSPARAWLIAILEALIAQETNQ